jgi:hypothetical protein
MAKAISDNPTGLFSLLTLLHPSLTTTAGYFFGNRNSGRYPLTFKRPPSNYCALSALPALLALVVLLAAFFAALARFFCFGFGLVLPEVPRAIFPRFER